MEPTNKPPVAKGKGNQLEVDFLPDADAIERGPLPAYIRITLHVMMGALVTFVLWASLSQVDKIVLARGRLVNPTPNIVVQPLETSIVQSIAVRAGQVVKKGDVLAVLDATFAKADNEQIRTKWRSLNTQLTALEQELKGGAGATPKKGDADGVLQQLLASERGGNYLAQQKKLEENVARLRASLDTNKRDQVVLAARLRSVLEIEQMQDKLVAQQFGARIRLLEARDKRLEVERDQLLTKNREQEIERELGALLAEQSAFAKSWRQKALEDMLNISRERDALAEQLAKADKRSALVKLVAPADAVVLEVAKMSPGSIVKEAETFFTLVPLGADMEAEVHIDSLDVGYIKPGAEVHVKFDAFPFQKHGDLKARMRVISEDSFKRETAGPQTEGLDAYYIGRVALGNAKLKNLSPQTRLLPGMTLSAEIVVGTRSVMSYLLWPLTRAVEESIREP